MREKTRRVLAAAVCGAVVMGTVPLVMAQGADAGAGGTGNGYVLGTRPESLYAHELLQLGQVDAIRAELKQAKARGDAAAEKLWNAQLLAATWGQVTRTDEDRAKAEKAYLAAVGGYLDSQRSGIDGTWALDHAKFIFARVSEPIINRMEYWANSAKDRAALKPMAALAARLLKQAPVSLAAGMAQAQGNGNGGFDEAAYTRYFRATAEAEYYSAWSDYISAMAMEPADPARKELLLTAAKKLGKWADDKQDNGVNNQSLLLRGKALSEAGEYDKAAADLTKAAESKTAPAWVKYQANYQVVVTLVRQGSFAAANAKLEFFKKALPQDNVDAQMSTDMLAYRVAWAESQKKQGSDKEKSELAALQILSNIIQAHPQFRTLVYQQLAAQVPEDAKPEDLLPMQALALAYQHSLGQKGESPESRSELKKAAAMAAAVYANPRATDRDKTEAAFLAGVSNALLKNLQDAATYNVDFAELAPTDPRAKQLLELALQQIGELRKISGTHENPELLKLQERALSLATGVYGDSRWRYAQARTLEDAGKFDDAAKIYSKIQPGDKEYLDAQFHLVSVATARFGKLPATAKDAEVKAAADQLFKACADFVGLLDHPPASANKDALERAKSYRADIWLIEASTALNPAVKRPEVALDRLNKLDTVKSQLTEAQQGAVLRYRIQAYQMEGKSDKAFAVLQEYARTQGKDAQATIHSMAFSTLQEINQTEKSNPAKARQLAQYMVKLLEPLIASAKEQKEEKTAYGYQQLQADMMVRAGQYDRAKKLANDLLGQNPQDVMNNMIEARAIFEKARETGDRKAYAEAEDYFGRILPTVTNGSESYWECWLRILQSKETLGGAGAAETIGKRLNDLRAAFGGDVGGELYKDDFKKLYAKFAPATAK